MYRKIKLASKSSAAAPEAAAVFVFDDKALPEGLTSLDEQLGGMIAGALKRDEFTGGKDATLTLYPAEGKTERVYVLGLGKREKFTAQQLRAASARLVKAAFAAKVKKLAIHAGASLGEALDAVAAGRAVADGLSVGNFAFDSFKGKVNEKSPKPAAVDLTVIAEADVRSELKKQLGVGLAQEVARALAATPPNVAHPKHIANVAKKLAAKHDGLTCQIINEKQAKELGMGGILAVGSGASVPSCLIVLDYKPKGSKGDPLLLVGKSVTFDTGGYSLKPTAGMKGMKYDKCGGMAVLGAMQAIATLKLKKRVVALLPCVENMIDEDAMRVDDIITFCNGVTAEVTNTDAEGRLILADALAYGTKKYKPAAVIDLATLTGGVVVALGSYKAGMWCNDEALKAKIAAAADSTGEAVWELPLDEDYREVMKAPHADLHNSAPVRDAHPVQGAAFLSFFVGDDAPQQMPTVPWCHIDIAGVADLDRPSGLYDKGPTGWGVRLLTDLVREW